MKKIITLLLLFNSLFLFSQNNEKQNENLIYDSNAINVKPEFPEGLENLNTFLIKTGIKAKTKKEEKTETKMFAMFVVEKDGSLSDVKVLGKVESVKAEELKKVLMDLPKWIPGKQNGTIVRVLYVLPLLNNN
jgi:protein TonB